ncbi:MAG: acetyl-CoA C-acetyltransferase, partial [Blastocatellia bacterium]|nr:acetyl-CoA C-acetyltransferase [Blastocatellia bacterium]
MSEIKQAVIISAVRTPVGKFLGALKSFKATELGAIAVREAVKRAGVSPEDVDEVIMGCVIQAGLGQNPARQAALHGGLPNTVSAVTVNKVCGSGLKAIMMAAQGVQLGDTEIVVAGGMESMSNAPYLLPKAREGYRLGNGTLVDTVVNDGLWCAFDDQHMGCTGEVVSERFHVSRAEQDEYALNSHRKAVAAIKAGRFKDEIIPVEIKQRKGPAVIFDTDEPVREDTSLESLGKLKPAFKEDGTVTAGNAPGVND